MSIDLAPLNLWEKVVVRMINDNTLSLDQFQVHKMLPAIDKLMEESHHMTTKDLID